jgi:hypothetical protein
MSCTGAAVHMHTAAIVCVGVPSARSHMRSDVGVGGSGDMPRHYQCLQVTPPRLLSPFLLAPVSHVSCMHACMMCAVSSNRSRGRSYILRPLPAAGGPLAAAHRVRNLPPFSQRHFMHGNHACGSCAVHPLQSESLWRPTTPHSHHHSALVKTPGSLHRRFQQHACGM